MAKQKNQPAAPPSNRRKWLKWGAIAFVGLWVIGTLFPSDKTRDAQNTPTATSAEVAIQITDVPPTNTAESTTLVPSNTAIPTTAIPSTATVTASLTITFTPSHTTTATSIPPSPIPPTSTTAPIATTPPQTYYTIGEARLRSCPRLDCEVLVTYQAGTSLTVNGQIEGDAALTPDNRIWYLTTVNGQQAYVYSGLLTLTAPVPVSSGGNVSVPPPPQSGETCPDITANCPVLTCAQAYACLAAGHSGLDNDKDGVPCESTCPGG